ncbi:MAG: outer membrane protein assembly factor BamA [Sporocytophaga sp.]|uniref:outer membrane protein assembly factor BamA n=1 Tax=Sporocytophaga sp. TaxID=2231183 RepID=UPI001B19D2DE|nr:outer membrane protein assembly factor BamA [Sporocytophaga sp.]MBO9702318.1 outer membrane protein assembly factor BamA [Sporocytophaga sp.]
MKRFFLIALISILFPISVLLAQPIKKEYINPSYSNPEQYIIGGITVSGIQFLDPQAVIAITGLKTGDPITIPGEDITNAIKKLWEQGLIGDVEVSVQNVEGRKIFLDFKLKERARLSRFVFKGVKKNDEKDLSEKIGISKGKIVNDAMIKNAQKKVKDFYLDKGFLNTEVTITQVKDTVVANSVILKINVDRKRKVRIRNIIINGNEAFKDQKLKKKMKKTKEKRWYKLFTTSKLLKKEYEQDKANVIEYYNSQGYRDAEITFDTIYKLNHKSVNIKMDIDEGKKYYFGNITWTGNFIYDDKTLSRILAINKGDVYNLANLQKRLNYNPSGADISSLYLDDGYLFFSVDPVEVLINGDSIDIEMRIYEGPQATIKNVTVSGNTKTHDHVVLREIRTYPGQKFSRADLIRSQREIGQLGYFNAETIGVNPVPNPQEGTVDIHYTVEEKPSDQIELSGGWGGYFGFVGTLGLVFNNFSARNLSKPKTWSPLPAGDGQRLALRLQANGRAYQTYSLSFTEPWLGGRRPQSFSISLSRSAQNLYNSSTGKYNAGHLYVTAATVSLGRELKWPDDYFSLSNSLSFVKYDLDNYSSAYGIGGIGFTTGYANNFSFITSISRNSVNDFTFPTGGSNLNLTITATPPYSLFNGVNYENPKLSSQERYRWIEFHKWMVDQSWFVPLIPPRKPGGRSLVLNLRAHLGFIGSYKKSTGIGPFERFIMGGSGITGYNFLLGSDIIGLRGYQDNVIKPVPQGGTIFDKFVAEIRYPVNLSPALSVFVLGFFEGGNNWNNFQDFNPFKVYRSAGVGTRIFMPAFGMIGLDWGYGFDAVPGLNKGSKVTFTIGQQIR